MIPMGVTLDNIAALRIFHRFPSAVLVLGYATPGDGGGGTFLWHAEATEDDDSATIIVPDRPPRRGGSWKRLYAGVLSYRWFGGSPIGASVSNRTALQNAVDRASSLGTSVHVPAGVYPINFDSSGGILVPVGKKVRIHGDGKDVSTFTMPGQQMGAVVCFAPGINSELELEGITIEGPVPTALQQSSCIETDEPCHVILRDTRIGVAGRAFRKCIAFTSDGGLYRLEIERHSQLRAYGEAVVYVNGGAGSEVRLFHSTFHNENDTGLVFPTADSTKTGHGIQTGDPVAVLAVGCRVPRTWTPTAIDPAPDVPAGGYAFYPLISDNPTRTAPPQYYAIIACWLGGVRQGIAGHQDHLDPDTGAIVPVPTLVEGCTIEGDPTYTGLLFRPRGHLMIRNTIVRGGSVDGSWALAFDETSMLSIEGCDFRGKWIGGGIHNDRRGGALWRIADSYLENDSNNVVWGDQDSNFELDRVRILKRGDGNGVFAHGGKWYIRGSAFIDAQVEANEYATTLKLVGNRFQGTRSVLNLATAVPQTILSGSDNVFVDNAHPNVTSGHVIGHLKPPDGINPTPIRAAQETLLHPNYTSHRIVAGDTINTLEVQVPSTDPALTTTPTARRGYSGPFVLIFDASVTIARDFGGVGSIGAVLLQGSADQTFTVGATLTLMYDSVAGKWRELARSIA